MVVTRALRNLTAIAVLVLATTLTAADGKVRIVQTNSAGDNVHLIDPGGRRDQGHRGESRSGGRSRWEPPLFHERS